MTWRKGGSSPDVVAGAVHHALTSSRARIRYRVGKHARLLATLPKILPERVMDALIRGHDGILRAEELRWPAQQRTRARSDRRTGLNPK